jgi:hypothetical protein
MNEHTPAINTIAGGVANALNGWANAENAQAFAVRVEAWRTLTYTVPGIFVIALVTVAVLGILGIIGYALWRT